MGFLLGVAVTLVLVILLLLLLLKLGLFALLFTKTGAIEHTKERILSEAPKYVLNEVSKIAKEKNFEETIKNKTGSIFDRVTESLALFDIKSLFKPKSEQKKPVMNTHVSETWAPSKTDATNLDVKNSLETTDIKGTEQTTPCHPSEKSTTASEWYEQEVKILDSVVKRF